MPQGPHRCLTLSAGLSVPPILCAHQLASALCDLLPMDPHSAADSVRTLEFWGSVSQPLP